MDLVLIAVGIAALFAGWRMKGTGAEVGSGAALLLGGGALALIVGSVFFGVTFVDGFQRGLGQSR